MGRLVKKLGPEPITIEEAKLQCYLHPSVEDNESEMILERLIKTARVMAENYVWYGLVYGKYEHTLNGFDGDLIEIPFPPLHSIDKITYKDPSGETKQLLVEDLHVDKNSEPGLISPVAEFPKVSDAPGSVLIEYTAGYKAESGEDGSARIVIPEDIKTAMLIIVKFLFDHRDTMMPERTTPLRIPDAAMAILEPYRLWRYE